MPRPWANASWPRSRSSWRAGARPAARPPPPPAARRAASGAPASYLAWAAASARTPRRAGSGVSSADRSRTRPPRPRPRGLAPGRLNVPTRRRHPSSGPVAAGHDATPGGRDRGLDRSPRPGPGAPPDDRHRRRPVDRRAHERMAESHPGAELDQPRGLGRRGGAAPDAELIDGPPQQRHVAGRLRGRRGATAVVRRKRLEPPQEALARYGSPAAARRAAQTRLPAPRRVSPRGSSSNASGLPRVSATIRSRTRSSTAPVIAESSNAGRRRLPRPPTAAPAGPPTPLLAGLPHREHQSTGSATGGGPQTPAPARRPDRATARHRRGRQAAAPRPPRTAAEDGQTDQEPVRRLPGTGRTTVHSASRCGPAGRRAGRASARRADVGRRTRAPSRTQPRRARDTEPGRLLGRKSSNAVLPTPASPRNTTTRLLPARAAFSNPSSTARSVRRPRNPGPG